MRCVSVGSLEPACEQIPCTLRLGRMGEYAGLRKRLLARVSDRACRTSVCKRSCFGDAECATRRRSRRVRLAPRDSSVFQLSFATALDKVGYGISEWPRADPFFKDRASRLREGSLERNARCGQHGIQRLERVLSELWYPAVRYRSTARLHWLSEPPWMASTKTDVRKLPSGCSLCL